MSIREFLEGQGYRYFGPGPIDESVLYQKKVKEDCFLNIHEWEWKEHHFRPNTYELDINTSPVIGASAKLTLYSHKAADLRERLPQLEALALKVYALLKGED